MIFKPFSPAAPETPCNPVKYNLHEIETLLNTRISFLFVYLFHPETLVILENQVLPKCQANLLDLGVLLSL